MCINMLRFVSVTTKFASQGGWSLLVPNLWVCAWNLWFFMLLCSVLVLWLHRIALYVKYELWFMFPLIFSSFYTLLYQLLVVDVRQYKGGVVGFFLLAC